MGAQTDYSNEELPTCEIPACITTLMIHLRTQSDIYPQSTLSSFIPTLISPCLLHYTICNTTCHPQQAATEARD